VEPVRAGFGYVVDLSRAVPPLIDGIEKGVDGYLRD